MASPAFRARRAIPAVTTVLALAALGAFLVHHRAYIAETWALRPGRMAAIAALAALSLFVRGLSNQQLFGRLGVEAGAVAWFRIVTASALSNYLPLSAGLIAKAFFLKRLHAMAYGRFAAAQGSLLVLVLTTHGAIALGVLLTGAPFPRSDPLAVAFALMACAGGVLCLPASLIQRLGGRTVDWDAGTGRAVRRSAPAVMGLQGLILLITATSLHLAFGMGGADVTLGACLILGAGSVVTRIVSITPGAIGIREGLIGALAVVTGYPLRDAVIAATVVRTLEMAVIFGLGSAVVYGLSGRLVDGPAPPDPPFSDSGRP